MVFRSTTVRCLSFLLLASALPCLSGCRASSGWMMNHTGMRQYQRGNYAAAKSNFMRAVADAPNNADYRYNLAMAMKNEGDMAAAEQVLRHNTTIGTMHQPTYHALAQTLVEQGRANEANELLTSWSESQPYVPEAHIEQAWLYRETGNVAEAENSLQRALAASPNNPVALAQLGQVYQDSGQSDRATALYQRSLVAKWNQPQVQSRLASLNNGVPGSRAAMAMQPSNIAMPQTAYHADPVWPGSVMGNAPGPMSGPAMRQAMHPAPQTAYNDLGNYAGQYPVMQPNYPAPGYPMMGQREPLDADHLMFPAAASPTPAYPNGMPMSAQRPTVDPF